MFPAALLFDDPVGLGGVADGTLPAVRTVGPVVRFVDQGAGGSDDGAGSLKEVDRSSVAGQMVGDRERARRSGKQSSVVQACLDAVGEATPGVLFDAACRHRPKLFGEMTGYRGTGGESPDPGHPLSGECRVDRVQVALGKLARPSGEDGPGIAQAVKPVGERVVLVDGAQHGPSSAAR